MIKPNIPEIIDMINSPVRRIKARVELLEGSTLLKTFGCDSNLISFDIQRVGEGKFFGYGICSRLNVKLIDTKRELNITTANTLEIVWGCENDIEYHYTLPLFKVAEVHRDEETNELSITAYDWLYNAVEHKTDEITLTAYSIKEVARECASILGLNLRLDGLEGDTAFNTYYAEGANLDGTETIRELLDDIAEATQTIYFVNKEWELVFKRLTPADEADLVIDREKYFTLTSKTNRRLSAICHTTELEDNVSAKLAAAGSTQYVRNNAFYELREDIGELINLALANVGGLTLNQFEMEWRGNYLLEVGDKIAIENKDGSTAYSYLLDDTINYDGSYSQTTRWSYEDNESESESNPTTIGEALKQTYARVDKANKQIELVASEVEENGKAISSLILTTGEITTSVSKTEETYNEITGEMEKLTKKVDATMTAEDITLSIQKELENGTNKVITATGYKFDDEGLTVSKTNSEMTTTISEDGMVVYKNDNAVLTANNAGVDAVNLKASTYLIIGTTSRFEDYQYNGETRTGCFWIGK